MKASLINEICSLMSEHLTEDQGQLLKINLQKVFQKFNIPDFSYFLSAQAQQTNIRLLNLFIAAKKIEGCSENTLKYYSATLLKTKIHLQQYLSSRNDTNCALFVGLHSPWNRLSIAGVERFLTKLGDASHVPHVHPHKFRRTMATMAIEKGMPIEQLQKLLGHTQIDTTLHYAIVNETNIKLSHQKYIC